jgi:hypothetical protein
LGGPAERVLGALGIDVVGMRPSASDAWLSEERGVFASPTSVLTLVGTRLLSVGERFDVARFFLGLDRVDPASVASLSTTAWLDRLGYGPRARRFLEMLVRVSTYSNAPDIVPATIALRQLQVAVGLHARGVVYVEGGWQSLVSQIAEAAKDAGVRIVTDAHVQRVTPDAVVTLDSGRAIHAAHVVVALPRAAAHVAIPELGAASLPPVRAACLDLVLDEAPQRRLVFGLDEPHYFSVHSPKDTKGNVRAHALRYLGLGESGDASRGALEDWLERVTACRAHVVSERFLPEMDVASAFPSTESATTSLGDAVSMVGDWTSVEHILFDAVAESAETAVARVRARRTRRAA